MSVANRDVLRTSIAFAGIASAVCFLLLIIGFYILEIPGAWGRPAFANLLVVIQQSVIITGVIVLPCALIAGLIFSVTVHSVGYQPVWSALMVCVVACVLAWPVVGSAVLDDPSVWGTGLMAFTFIPAIAGWLILARVGFLE